MEIGIKKEEEKTQNKVMVYFIFFMIRKRVWTHTSINVNV